ncbi:MAG: GGDEF domain-containing protein [Actinomycetota bacterium]|nr:GGDEF domain-containing protein [Actinomycetota bacterium]
MKAWLNEHLYQALNKDHLTGLLAKPRFDEEFERALEAARARGEPLGIIMADVDNLKEINDEHGHLVGEFAVGEIGRIIGSFQDENRRATCFGGDEYQVILPGEGNAAAVEMAELIRRNVEGRAFEREGVTFDPTLSLGVAAYPSSGPATKDLTRAADRALYRTKQTDGNTVGE